MNKNKRNPKTLHWKKTNKGIIRELRKMKPKRTAAEVDQWFKDYRISVETFKRSVKALNSRPQKKPTKRQLAMQKAMWNTVFYDERIPKNLR